MTNIRTNVAGTVILKNRPFCPGKGDRIFKKRKKNGQKAPNLIKFRSKGSQIGAIREVRVQVGWDNQAKFHLDDQW